MTGVIWLWKGKDSLPISWNKLVCLTRPCILTCFLLNPNFKSLFFFMQATKAARLALMPRKGSTYNSGTVKVCIWIHLSFLFCVFGKLIMLMCSIRHDKYRGYTQPETETATNSAFSLLVEKAQTQEKLLLQYFFRDALWFVHPDLCLFVQWVEDFIYMSMSISMHWTIHHIAFCCFGNITLFLFLLTAWLLYTINI